MNLSPLQNPETGTRGAAGRRRLPHHGADQRRRDPRRRRRSHPRPRPLPFRRPSAVLAPKRGGFAFSPHELKASTGALQFGRENLGERQRKCDEYGLTFMGRAGLRFEMTWCV